ncbi:hypothetical protein LIER_12343 [Lithospermum erythrorhizon]|uniref:RING-type domain-containing protein n=1 Tax=Lithospermum erythrorhizon TaxID=34254 RepID=A0AAV3PRD2_LITER
MGCSVREKHIRANRRSRSVKSESDHQHPYHHHHLVHHAHHLMHPCCNGKNSDSSCNISMGKSMMEPMMRSMSYQMGFGDSGYSQNPNSNSSISSFDDSGWGYCTEEQLEEILLTNLDYLYNEAISELKDLGYEEEAALKAVLRNGRCYGGLDVLANILQNSLPYLNNDTISDEPDQVFTDLKQLEEYSLAGMVCLLQQVKPHLSRGDAMWCLLMSDLHVGRASTMDIPVLQPPNGSACCSGSGSGTVSSNVEGVNNSPVGVAPSLCKFHGGWGFGSAGTSEFPANALSSLEKTPQMEIECPKRFNLSPSMKKLLKRNVAAFAAGYRANSKQLQNQSESCAGSSSGHGSSGIKGACVENHAGQGEEPENLENLDTVNTMLGKFRDLNLEENAEHKSLNQKDEMILILIHQIKELEKTVQDRKDWAHEKAMQAARKLSHDLTELKLLRMEKEETQRLKRGKQTIEDSTMKKLSDMENALRKASARVDRANAAVRKLETENAEMRAEMEASKLSASESVKTCLEVAKREKKCLKRLLAWEKQKTKLQEETGKEKQKISDLQKELLEVEEAQNEAEAKWRLEQKAKDHALGQVDKERRLKEAAESGSKRNSEALRLKIELDSQRHKDDLQRLEQELSRLQASVQSANTHPQSINTMNSRNIVTQHEFYGLEDSPEKETSWERECFLCKKDEVSIVFLPCAHLVLCANCNENYGRKGKALCPCCGVPIDERIRVFGTTS